MRLARFGLELHTSKRREADSTSVARRWADSRRVNLTICIHIHMYIYAYIHVDMYYNTLVGRTLRVHDLNKMRCPRGENNSYDARSARCNASALFRAFLLFYITILLHFHLFFHLPFNSFMQPYYKKKKISVSIKIKYLKFHKKIRTINFIFIFFILLIYIYKCLYIYFFIVSKYMWECKGIYC